MSKHKEKLKEFRSFCNNEDENVACIEITKVDEEKITVNIGEMFDFDFHFNEIKFTSEEEGVEELIEKITKYITDNNSASIRAILKKFTFYWLEEMEDDDEGDSEEEYVGEFASPVDAALLEKDPFAESPVKKKVKEPSEREILETLRSQFDLKDANPVAVNRLLKDYYELQKCKSLGFHGYPKGKNLFDWEVRLTKFDLKTDPIAKDLVEYKKKFGIDYILLSIKFPSEYPFKPPFIRVIKPRCKYLTGHITIGGSICMQILTTSGWIASSSIENIMVQILLAMSQGGARIDFTKTSDYQEFEAKEAFFRVAQKYGWEK